MKEKRVSLTSAREPSRHARIGYVKRLNRRGVLRLGVAILLLVGLIVGGERLLHRAPPPGVTLTDLDSVDQLRATFNADRGVPRLIVILSPT
jgi:hypothetical protein